MSEKDDDGGPALSAAGWIALAVLAGFLAASIWYAVVAWTSLVDVQMSWFGWFALIFGSLLTVTVGGGLMALLFYSNRHGFDR